MRLLSRSLNLIVLVVAVYSLGATGESYRPDPNGCMHRSASHSHTPATSFLSSSQSLSASAPIRMSPSPSPSVSVSTSTSVAESVSSRPSSSPSTNPMPSASASASESLAESPITTTTVTPSGSVLMMQSDSATTIPSISTTTATATPSVSTTTTTTTTTTPSISATTTPSISAAPTPSISSSMMPSASTSAILLPNTLSSLAPQPSLCQVNRTMWLPDTFPAQAIDRLTPEASCGDSPFVAACSGVASLSPPGFRALRKRFGVGTSTASNGTLTNNRNAIETSNAALSSNVMEVDIAYILASLPPGSQLIRVFVDYEITPSYVFGLFLRQYINDQPIGCRGVTSVGDQGTLSIPFSPVTGLCPGFPSSGYLGVIQMPSELRQPGPITLAVRYWGVEYTSTEICPSTSPSPTPTFSETASTSYSGSISNSPSTSTSTSVSRTPSLSATASASVSETSSPSPTASASKTPSHSASPTRSSSASVSAVVLPSVCLVTEEVWLPDTFPSQELDRFTPASTCDTVSFSTACNEASSVSPPGSRLLRKQAGVGVATASNGTVVYTLDANEVSPSVFTSFVLDIDIAYLLASLPPGAVLQSIFIDYETTQPGVLEIVFVQESNTIRNECPTSYSIGSTRLAVSWPSPVSASGCPDFPDNGYFRVLLFNWALDPSNPFELSARYWGVRYRKPCPSASLTPSITPSTSITPSISESMSTSASLSSSFSPSSSPIPGPSVSASVSATPSPSPTNTATPTPSDSPTSSPSDSPTSSPSDSTTSSPSDSATSSPSDSATSSPSDSATSSPSESPTASSSYRVSNTPTNSPSPSKSVSHTTSKSGSVSRTISKSSTKSKSRTTIPSASPSTSKLKGYTLRPSFSVRPTASHDPSYNESHKSDKSEKSHESNKQGNRGHSDDSNRSEETGHRG